MPRSTASDDEYEPSPGRGRGGGGDVIQNMPYDEALELSQESEASSLADGKPSPAVHKSNCRGASSPLLNHDLHAHRKRVSTMGKEPDPFVLRTAGNYSETFPVRGGAPRVVAVGSARLCESLSRPVAPS